MKKPFAIALLFTAAFGLAACDKPSENKAQDAAKTEQKAQENLNKAAEQSNKAAEQRNEAANEAAKEQSKGEATSVSPATGTTNGSAPATQPKP